MDLSECENLTEIPDLSKATNLKSLKLNNCKSLLMFPSTIGNLHKLVKLYMADCTWLEVLPTDVHLSSLKILDLSGCSSLRSFPQISWSIEWLYLENTAIEEVPCCIENFSSLTVLMMYRCKSLKNISPNIFRLKRLKIVDFTDCRGVIMAFSDASMVATMEDHSSCIPLYENTGYERIRYWEDKCYSSIFIWAFSFQNCFKLDRDARELIIRSCFKPVALPGGEVPTYFQHQAYGDSLTVTLPHSSFSQKFLRFKACIVVDLLTTGKYLAVNVGFNGRKYWTTLLKEEEMLSCSMAESLLILCSFKFQPTDLPSKLAFNDVEFKFFSFNKIKECGVQLLKIKDDSGGSSETEPPNDSDGSKKRMRMTSGTSEEYIVADTGLDALNLELSLGQGEASSVSSYPCLERVAFSIITEQQESLKLKYCESLVTVPSTIGNLQKLVKLEMQGCTRLEVLPTDVNLSSLKILNLKGCLKLRMFPQISKSIETLSFSGCLKLRSFPQISWSIETLNLDDTAIEQVPCIKNLWRLNVLTMSGCKMLKNISPNIFRLIFKYAYVYEDELFSFQNCFKLDRDARELILRSWFELWSSYQVEKCLCISSIELMEIP